MGQLLLFVGSLNREAPYFQGARGRGLVVYDFDEDSLTATELAGYPQVENPTFLSVTEDGSRVYTNSEVFGWAEGLVTAFDFDGAAFRYLNTQPTLGSITAFNRITGDGRHLLVVNYTIGDQGPMQSLALFGITSEGLTPALCSLAHQGSGPDPARQERAHVHWVGEIAPGVLMVTDLGADRLITYRIAGDKLTPWASTQVSPGAGPRHVALHPGGRFAFVMNELNSTVSAHEFDPATGQFRPLGSQPAAPEEALAQNHCSDIQISPDGRFVYGGNRGHDSVSIFAVDPATGRLTLQGFTPSGGATPRNLALTPSGRHLLVANQNSDRISILARDAGTGALTDTGQTIQIGTPMCLKFAAR